MSARFFLDTNVFVYAFDSRTPAKARTAAQLIRRGVDGGEGIISYQVVQEFFNIALCRFTQPMTSSEAEQYLISVFRPLLAVHSSPALYLDALRISGKHHIGWYDALILAAAIEAHCVTLYSEDFQDGRKLENVTIKNPFAS
jgi:predicted nucleic acid-binding protein